VSAPVGLIAGSGRFPAELARCVRRGGRSVVAAALRELAAPELAGDVDRVEWVWLGELGALVAAFRREGVEEVVLAGKVPKAFLWTHRSAVRPDARAAAVLARLGDRRDDTLLGAVARALEAEGFQVRGQAELAPELLAPEGALGLRTPTAAQTADVAFGWPVAKALGALDVGQTVVVRGRAVLALEAIEGTDAAIRRGCALGEPGACVVKVAKPAQDPRFDVPAVGPETVRVLAECGGAVLALEAHRTLVLERARLVAEADACGVAVVGVTAAGLGLEEPR
jgi:DUF1009 family protein